MSDCKAGGVLLAMRLNSSSVRGNSRRIAVHTSPGVAAGVVVERWRIINASSTPDVRLPS